MKTTLGLLMWAAALALAGCSNTSDRDNRDANDVDKKQDSDRRAKEQPGKPRTSDTEEPAQTERDRVEFEKRKAAFRKELADRLAEMDRKAAELKARADKATGDVKQKMLEEYDRLKASQDDLARRTAVLEKTGRAAWDETAKGIDQAAKDMKAALDRAWEKFK
jgi:hypothetical protein